MLFTSKDKLNNMINKSNTRIFQMKDEINSMTKIIKMATDKTIGAAISDTISYLMSHTAFFFKRKKCSQKIWN